MQNGLIHLRDAELIARNIENVTLWAQNRGILDAGSERKQAAKTYEETEELAVAVYEQDKAEIKDAIGDILVTLIIQAEMQGFTLLECLEQAYGQIKDRQGEMRHGTFVKDTEED